MSAPEQTIRTPDQRLRVFVSSTLRELAPERRAVRAAIEQLGLAPVMFELGARPHPPRDLYRSYLAQSDIFVGIYAGSYGWVAPGEQISGLEDEYRLAPPELPKLVYVKEGVEREPRLDELLASIKHDDRASYAYFADPDGLAQLVRADLTTLLAERFARGATGAADAAIAPSRLPAVLTSIVGREQEVARVVDLVRDDAVRLVTITGPGGIGKTRLGLEAASRAASAFPDGVVFVDLAPVSDPALVPAAIAEALGVREAGLGDPAEKLRVALRDRRLLLLLDNVEQVVAAAPGIRSLLADLPQLTVLATSRVLLRVSGEHGVELDPLPVPDVERATSVAEAGAAASVALFVERVRAVKPDFELTPENVDDVVRICAAVDGLPLAIELAAARARLLAPAELAARLDRGLLELGGGARDLPERQRTIRSTIDWSAHLLEPAERTLLARLGCFAGEFGLDAAEWMGDDLPGDTLDLLAALVEGSLVRQEDRGERTVFSMLSTVREYARDQLRDEAPAGADAGARDADAEELRAVRDRYAAWVVRLGEEAEYALEGAEQHDWIERLARHADDIRQAMRHLLDTRQWRLAAHLAWTLYVYWWVGSILGEVRGYMREVLDSGDELDTRTRAVALYYTLAIAFWQDPPDDLVQGLEESARLFGAVDEPSGEALALVSVGLALLARPEPDVPGAYAAFHRSLDRFRDGRDRWGEAMALVTLGRLALLAQDVPEGVGRFEQSLAVARAQGDDLGVTIALHHLGWARVLQGDLDGARRCFEESLAGSMRLNHDEGIAYGLEGLTAVAAATGDAERAGVLLGAAQRVRERTGLYNAPSFSFHRQYVDALATGGAAAAIEAGVARGRTLDVDRAADFAVQPAGVASAAGGTSAAAADGAPEPAPVAS